MKRQRGHVIARALVEYRTATDFRGSQCGRAVATHIALVTHEHIYARRLAIIQRNQNTRDDVCYT